MVYRVLVSDGNSYHVAAESAEQAREEFEDFGFRVVSVTKVEKI